MFSARIGHTATLLDNGRVLVTGGLTVVNADPVDAAELFNPRSDSWLQINSMTTGRHGHTATLLPDGLVLVAGGHGGTFPLDSVKLYVPPLVSGSPPKT